MATEGPAPWVAPWPAWREGPARDGRAALPLPRAGPLDQQALPWTAAGRVWRFAAAPERRGELAHLAWCSRRVQAHAEEELGHLGALTYLDHAGAALYSRAQVQAAEKALTGALLANPHSSQATEQVVARARAEALELLGASPETHALVFTSGAGRALELLGETFAWPRQPTGGLLLCAREGRARASPLQRSARRAGVACGSFGLEDLGSLGPGLGAAAPQPDEGWLDAPVAGPNLVFLPAECDFTGVRAELDCLTTLRAGGMRWRVALDASRLLATAPGTLDLRSCPADFVVVSFHRVFGYPTGLGALVVRHDAAPLLAPSAPRGGAGGPVDPFGPAYFAGGCVASVSATSSFAVARPGMTEWLERGTPHYQGIASLPSQLAVLRELGPARARRMHAISVYREAYLRMRGLRHAAGGSPLCTFVGKHEHPRWLEVQGPTIAFVLHWADGSDVPPDCLARRARARGVVLHVGGLDSQRSWQSCRPCRSGSESGGCRCLAREWPAVAASVSFGLFSTLQDVGCWVALLREEFLDRGPPADGCAGPLAGQEAEPPLQQIAMPGRSSSEVREKVRGIRAQEFGHLGQIAYLDHAGAALYSREQVRAATGTLLERFLASPERSAASAAVVEGARADVLRMFGASPETHELVFTSGATRALQLVGELFPWSADGLFLYARESHTSALGLRQLARRGGARCGWFGLDQLQELSHGVAAANLLSEEGIPEAQAGGEHFDALPRGPNLLAVPGESNFDGARAELASVAALRSGPMRWSVILDAAKLACLPGALDLSKCPADFVTVSFYKIFGYPTGLGALIVRREAAALLLRRGCSTGGAPGTLATSRPECSSRPCAGLEPSLESGAPHWQGIAALPRQLALARAVASDADRRRHVLAVCRQAYVRTRGLRHCAGGLLCTIFGRHEDPLWLDVQGPTIALALSWSDGSPVPYGLVQERALARGIILRTGCHCNAGSCQKHLDLTDADLRHFYSSGKVCGDDLGIIDGRHTGVVRISFGLYSLEEDVDRWVAFLEEEFLDRSAPRAASGAPARPPREAPAPPRVPTPPVEPAARRENRVVGLKVYPIKGCGPLRVRRWPLDPASGALLLDRRWCLAVGEAPRLRPVSAKQAPRLTQVSVDLQLSPGERPALVLSAKGVAERLLLPLAGADTEALRRSGAEVAAGRPAEGPLEAPAEDGADGLQPSERIARWFESLLSLPKLRLLEAGTAEGPGGAPATERHFANGPGTLLLVSSASLLEFGRLCGLQVPADRFRANLEVDYQPAFAEAAWRRGQAVQLGAGGDAAVFEAAGRCVRCQAVDINPEDAASTGPSLLAALATVRPGGAVGETSGPTFGVLLRLRGGGAAGAASACPHALHVGMPVYTDDGGG